MSDAAAWQNGDADVGHGKLAEVVKRLRTDPNHKARMESFRAAMAELQADGRRHNLDEVEAALNRHGFGA